MRTHNNSVKNSFENRIFPQNTIDTLIFNHLISNLEIDPDSSIENVIAFASEHEEWSMSFFAEHDSDFHHVTLQDFGFITIEDGVERWVQCRPTSEQLSVLQSIIDTKADELAEEASKEWEAKREAASYDVRKEQGLFGYGY